ncbi:unnamed protein product [Gadus morhua 'NCC']
MSPPVLQGVMRPPVLQGVMSPPDLQGVMSPPVLQGVMSPPVLQGVMSPPVLQGVMSPPVLQGVMSPPDLQGVMRPPDLQGVMSPIRPAGWRPGGLQSVLHEEQWKMPALPALLLSITVLALLLTPAACSPSPAHTLVAVRMAAILDEQASCGRGERLALALARENINSLLEDAARGRVEVDVYDLPRDSQYHTTETSRSTTTIPPRPILPKGVVSVIGPASSPASVSTVSHICGEKEIPHVKIGPEETPRLPFLRFSSLTLLICSQAECLLRLEELVRRFLISRETLSVRMLDDSQDPTPLLKEIRDDKVATIIIDANASTSYHILRKARELGMTSSFYKYILTTMDFPWLHLGDVVDEQSNIVGFSMLNSSHPFYLEFHRSLTLSWREGCSTSTYPGPALSAALLFDAVHVVVAAVQELNRSQDIGVRPLSCTSPLIWQHGTSLMNYLRMVEFEGLTGRVEFNSKGQRTNYTLKILEKHPDGHKEIGVWYSNNTLVMNSTSLDVNVSESLVNKTLVVTTILEKPYVMRRKGPAGLQGNEQYEGFCVDMLRELADILRFSFRIKLVDDGLYGAPEPNGSWNGMVGELINRVWQPPQRSDLTQPAKSTCEQQNTPHHGKTRPPTREIMDHRHSTQTTDKRTPTLDKDNRYATRITDNS